MNLSMSLKQEGNERDGMNLTQVLQQTFNISPLHAEIITSILILVGVALIGWVAYFISSRYVSAWVKKTETKLDDNIVSAIRVITIIMIIIFGVRYALSPLSFIQPYNDTISDIFLVLEIMLCAFAITRVSNIVADWYANKTALSNGQNSPHLLFILKKVIQIIVFTFAILIVLYAFQVDLTGALVGLGVGSVVIAFALQSTLSDFFSAFSIYFDRPFEVGDFVVIGEYSGFVTNIGLKSTRIKLLQGEELIVPNKEISATKVRNFKKLEKRRVTFNIGVTYDTKVEKLKKIPFLIKEIFDGLERAELSRVHFFEYGEYSLKFQIVYFVNSSDYTEYLDIQQYVNLGIKEAFEREGIEFAYPTSNIYIKNQSTNLGNTQTN